MKKKVLLTLLSFACALCCTFGLVACNDVAVTGVTLNKTELTLTVGGEETLTATVAPDNATKKDVSWSSDKTDVATVANGKVTAVAAGTAKITATAGGKSATCTVTVQAAQAANVKMTEEEWKASCTAFVTANNYTMSAKYEGKISSVQKSTATALSMSDPAEEEYDMIIAKDGNVYYGYDKEEDSEGEGFVWVKSVITEEIYEEYCEYSSSITIAAITACSNSYSSFEYADGKYTAATIHIEDLGDLKNVVLTAEGTAWKKVTCTLSWEVEEGDEAEEYELEIYDIGTTTIDVPNLPNVAVTGISFEESTVAVSVQYGNTSIRATVAPANATNKLVNWTSSDPSVVTVEGWGYSIGADITVVGVGTAVITATTVDGNKSATCTVKVVPETLVGQTFKLTSLEIRESGAEEPLEDEQVPQQLQPLLTNVGKTAICESQADGDGKYDVKGTCNFGVGAMDNLTGEFAYKLEYDNGSVTVTNQYDELHGYYNDWNGTLELSMYMNVGGTDYYITITFAWECENA